MQKSAWMHIYNLTERIRKNVVKSPPQDILDRIDAAFTNGEYETSINLCQSGTWGSKYGWTVMNKDIKAVMDAQVAWFKEHPEEDLHDVDDGWMVEFENNFGKYSL